MEFKLIKSKCGHYISVKYKVCVPGMTKWRHSQDKLLFNASLTEQCLYGCLLLGWWASVSLQVCAFCVFVCFPPLMHMCGCGWSVGLLSLKTTAVVLQEGMGGGDLPVLWIYRATRVCGAFYSCHNSWWTSPPATHSWTVSGVWSPGPSPPRRRSRSAPPSTGSNGRSRAPSGSRTPRRGRRRAAGAARAVRSNLWRRRATRRWRTPARARCVWVWESGWAWADPRIPARTTTCPPFASGAAPLPIAGTATPENPRGNRTRAARRASTCCCLASSSAGTASGRRTHIRCWTAGWRTARSPTGKSANPTASHFAGSGRRGATPRRPRRRPRRGQRPWAARSSARPRCRTCTRWTKSPARGPVWGGWRSSSRSRSWSPPSCLHFQPRRGALFCRAGPLLPPGRPWLDSWLRSSDSKVPLVFSIHAVLALNSMTADALRGHSNVLQHLD